MNGCRVVVFCSDVPIFPALYEQRKTSFGQSDIVRLSDEDAGIELLERAVTGL
jgi:predicted Rossmann-fold nucleotide-binding protein